MIVGVGVDIVSITRMHHWLENKNLLSRFFHNAEISDILKKGQNSAGSLAARFAAKEAFGKALGTGLAGIRLRDIQVLNEPNGKPQILLHDSALEKFHMINGKKIHLSLTHEKLYALAFLIIEGD